MKRVIPLFLALCLLLCACKKTPADTTTTIGSTAEPTMTALPTEAPTEEATKPTEAPMLYHNPLSGEPSAEPWTTRIFASTINNVPAAMPHHGVSQAEIIYECLVEGGATRCLALFSNVEEVEKIGSVRSARECFVHIASAYNAILSHAGGNAYSDDAFYFTGCDDLDALGSDGGYYYRDDDRLSMGYSYEHTLFTSGENMMSYAEDMGYDLTVEGGIDFGYQFAEDATPKNGETAKEITVYFEDYGKTTTMTYNSATGMYEGFEHGDDYIDGNTDQVVPFKNVFVLHSDTYYSGGLAFMELTGSGEGYFACGGKIIPILWSREDYEDPFTYTLEDGTPLVQGIGHSYVAIIPISSSVEYE